MITNLIKLFQEILCFKKNNYIFTFLIVDFFLQINVSQIISVFLKWNFWRKQNGIRIRTGTSSFYTDNSTHKTLKGIEFLYKKMMETTHL